MNLYDYELEEKMFLALPENRERMAGSLAARKDSLRFYQNSMTDRDIEKDPMYGIPGAYGLINAFLFDGITSEKTRVREGKSLHPELTDHMPSLLAAVRDIFYFFTASVMQGNCPAVTLYRTERAAGLEEMMKRKATVSLTSASRKCAFPDYLLEKEGICLLRIQVPANTPRIDVNAILTEGNAHPEEEEVILPPFLDLEIVRQEELFRGKIPVYSVQVKEMEGRKEPGLGDISRSDREKLCGRALMERCSRVLRAVENSAEPDPEDLEAYLAWKKLFKEAVLAWSSEAGKAAEICRKALELRARTDTQTGMGLMAPEEAVRIRIENAERMKMLSGIYISDMARFADRVLELSGLEKDYYDHYPADLGHPVYGPGSSPVFTDFRDLPDFFGYAPSQGDEIRFFVRTADGSRPAWMEVKMTVLEKNGEQIRGDIRIPGYTGGGELYTGDRGKDLLILSDLREDREDPVWKTKRKEPERRFRLRLAGQG